MKPGVTVSRIRPVTADGNYSYETREHWCDESKIVIVFEAQLGLWLVINQRVNRCSNV